MPQFVLSSQSTDPP
ncbi:hypothetical protein PENNAL_c0224G08342 [Penicillium nalgiovense]|uniref:Uncharacterized protein n=1 Tax=Penicillium nalgiovense TaxID=60175 RepID=A0A1V6WNU9_PENNA|nr:hypothetical protein PENNAL_c0224G08342 [Penicillium nalgiovense]